MAAAHDVTARAAAAALSDWLVGYEAWHRRDIAGDDEFARWLKEDYAAWPDSRTTIDNLIAEDDLVVVLFHAEMRRR